MEYQRLSPVSIEKRDIFKVVLAKMQAAIADEVRSGKIAEADLQRLGREMYHRK